MSRGVPSPDQMREIFKHVYLWYEQYKNAETDQDFINMVDDARKIRDKYNFEYTENQIIQLEEIIEAYYRERQKGD